MPAADIQPKVLQWLREMFNGVEEQDGGSIFVPGFGSTALFVYVQDVFENQHVRVLIDAPILIGVPVTKDLYEYIGYRSNDFVFGSFALVHSQGEKTGILVFRQTLLADALDKVELELASQVVAITADDLDNDLTVRFGGRTFSGQ